jgi:hypothetical protein
MGQIFSAVNATAESAIAHAVTNAFSATAGLFTLQNNGQGKLIKLRHIRLITATAPASATSFTVTLAVDTATRYSSGGTAITPKCCDASKSIVTNASNVYFGAVVLAAATAGVRYLDRIRLRHAIPVVGDEYNICFGDGSKVEPSSAIILNGTTPQRIVATAPEIILGYGHSFILHAYYPSNASTAAQYEFSAHWEEFDQ